MSNPVDSSFASACLPPGMESYLDGFLTDRVRLEIPAPRVKVRRVLTQLLATEPALDIEEVVIRGRSGCSDFVGTMDVRTTTGVHVFDFVWDCRWRAEHEGYVDYFGFPDQARAAREFDWQCFQRWERRRSN
jgi:hypothetical protein